MKHFKCFLFANSNNSEFLSVLNDSVEVKNLVEAQREWWILEGLHGHRCDSRPLKLPTNSLDTSVTPNTSIPQHWNVHSVSFHQIIRFSWKAGKSCSWPSPLLSMSSWPTVYTWEVHRKDSLWDNCPPFFSLNIKLRNFISELIFPLSSICWMLPVRNPCQLENEQVCSAFFVGIA